MISKKGNLRATLGALAVGAGLLLGAAVGARAQGYDPYYGQDTYGGRDYHRHQKDEKKAEKRHQKEEKEALKRHQKEEREDYGSDAELREHQRQEREELKYHERSEKEHRSDHQRDERDGYYGNDGRGDYGYGRDDRGYGSDVSRYAYDRGYQEGVRAGEDDRYNNRRYDYQRRSTYRDATAGYDSRYGDRDSYRYSFRDGYQRGYDEGYRRGNAGYGTRRGTDWGRVLGGIFGRP